MSERGQSPLVGLFVGGAARRMGGAPKGLLPAPSGEPIVERWRALCHAIGLRCVLVGEAAAYAKLGIEPVADARPSAGPLGGLVGLLRVQSAAPVVAVACDMPYVTEGLLRRLVLSTSAAAALAPWRDDLFEPLFARYDPARVLPLAERQLAGDDLSMQRLLREADAERFALSDDEWPLLADWDEPGDVET
jgi:molybdopterin-guanine dinucleotide biosynthesis protein A